MSDSSTTTKTYITLYDPSTNPSTLLKEWCSDQGSLTIGRAPKGKESEAQDPSTSIFRSDKTKVMSSSHAKLEWINDLPHLSDCGSTNGSYFVNKEEGNVQLLPGVRHEVSEKHLLKVVQAK